MNMSMQPKTYSPQKYNTALRHSEFPSSNNTVKKYSINSNPPFRQHPYNEQSPYTHSPQKMNYSIVSQDEGDLLKQRCYDLERELGRQRQESELQRMVQLRSNDLEGKVAEVVEHNNSLQNQLERAQKAVSQRKSEADMWKQKYEVQQSQLMAIKQNYEQEIRVLSSQIEEVRSRIGTCEQEKGRFVADQRRVSDTQNHQIAETFKRSNSMQAEMYEVQLKKVRDMLEDKTLQVSQMQAQLERQKSESNDVQLRLMNEVESYKSRLSAIQLDHQSELQSLKNKLEMYQESSLKNAQSAHENQQDLLQQDIDKLKNILEIKNQEIETLVNQNQKQKNQSEIEAQSLRSDIEYFKRQLLNQEQNHQEQNHSIQQNMETLHNNETINMKVNHENQVQALNNEILQLKEIIDCKNQEINKLIVEKAQQKDYYDGEVQRTLTTIEDYKRKLVLVENEKNREISDLLSRIERITIQDETIQEDLQKQINLLNTEIHNLKILIDHKNEDITQSNRQNTHIRSELEQKCRNLEQELEQQKLRAYEMEKSKIEELNELRQLFKDQEIVSREKIKQLESIVEHQKYEINKTLDLFTNKQKECDNLQILRVNQEQLTKRLEEENERLTERIYINDKEKNLEIEELRKKMDSGAAYQFENLKSAYNTQVGILSDQIQDLQNQLALKNRDLTEMVEKYTILDRTMLPDSVVARNTYNSRVGVPAEFIANKSIHEVSVRSQLRNSSIQRY